MPIELTMFEVYDLMLFVIGLSVLALATLLNRFENRPFSFPLFVLCIGYAAYVMPLGLLHIDPQKYDKLIAHLAELGVIISLMGVGLKIERELSWKTWQSTIRLLFICMPLTILAVALASEWLLGVGVATAILLGAALAPTDPVLASDVQVGEPNEPSQSKNSSLKEQSDDVRFALTSEAGLNDALAFPFVWLAILMLTYNLTDIPQMSAWLLFDVFYRIILGVIVGVALGWLLARVLLALPVDSERDKMFAGTGALAATLILYSVTEIFGGYGFLATFVGSLSIRLYEKSHVSHKTLHAFAEQTEQLFMTVILLGLGGAIAGGLLGPLTWEAALLGLGLIFFFRPVAGLISLLGCRSLPWRDRFIISFFGIRGIGSIFYSGFALYQYSFNDEDLLWAIIGFTVVVSIAVHSISAPIVMRYRDQVRDKQYNK